ncbi:MAG: transcription termination/antitermination protein NusA [Chloroflexi bacterium]|nr:transcription termination/antitermination protein NusA [Chloroflexota bacterium]
MKSEFIQAINQVCAERNLPKDVVLEAVEVALVSAYKRNFGDCGNVVAKIDNQTGEVKLFAVKEVVDSVSDPDTQIALKEARSINPDAAVGTKVMVECAPPKDFGRIAAQAAKQVILQRIREAERDTLYQSYADRVGEMINASVQTAEPGLVTVNLGKTEGVMPRGEMIPGERYRPAQRLRVVIVDVQRGTRGPEIIVSRAHRDLLRRLLEMEVPEILNGAVEVKAIAREAGSRSKVAVASKQPRLDPVGACVGQRGYRIQNIVNELNGEKIDVVAWSADTATFIANALSPAKPTEVILDETAEGGKTATVIVPDKQLSLAIGKEGQNVRLAAKLTGWRIDIKSASEWEEEQRYAQEKAQAVSEDLLAKAEAILLGKAEPQVGAEPAEVAAEVAEAPQVGSEPAAEEAALVEAAPEAEAAPAVTEAPAAEEAAPVAAAPEAEPAPAVTEAPVAEEAAPAVTEAPAAEEAAPVAAAPEVEPAPVAEVAEAPTPEPEALPIRIEVDELAFDDEGEGESEEEAGKRAKKKFKKGRAGAPQPTEVAPRRKPKPAGRRRDWGDDWEEEL